MGLARAQRMSEPPDVLDSEAAGPAAIRGGGLRVAGYALGVAVTTISAAVLFRDLGVDESGRYVTVLALVAVCAGATELGLTIVGVRELAVRGPEERAGLMAQLLGLRLVLSGAGALVAVAIAWTAYGGRLAEGAALTATATIVQAAVSTLSTQLQATLRFGWVTAVELGRQVIVAALIVAVALLDGGLIAFLAVQVPAALASLAVVAWLVRGDVPLRPAVSWSRWARLLKETLPFALASAVGVIYLRLIVLVTGAVTLTHQTGLFGASFRILEVLIVVPALVAGAAFPILARAARDDHDRLGWAVQRLWETCILLGWVVAVLLVPGAGAALDVITGGGDFAEAVPALRWCALALVASFSSAATGYTLLTLGAYSAILKVNLAALVAAVALTTVLAAEWGAAGAGAAALGTELVLAAGNLIALQRRAAHLRIRPARGVRCTAAAGVAIAAGLASGLPAVPAAACAGAVFAVLAFVLRGVPPELLAGLRPSPPPAGPAPR